MGVPTLLSYTALPSRGMNATRNKEATFNQDKVRGYSPSKLLGYRPPKCGYRFDDGETYRQPIL